MTANELDSRVVVVHRCFSERGDSILSVFSLVSSPDPTLSRGKGSGVYRALSWAFRLYESGDFLQ